MNSVFLGNGRTGMIWILTWGQSFSKCCWGRWAFLRTPTRWTFTLICQNRNRRSCWRPLLLPESESDGRANCTRSAVFAVSNTGSSRLMMTESPTACALTASQLNWKELSMSSPLLKWFSLKLSRKMGTRYPQYRVKTLLPHSAECVESQAQGKKGVMKRPQKQKPRFRKT